MIDWMFSQKHIALIPGIDNLLLFLLYNVILKTKMTTYTILNSFQMNIKLVWFDIKTRCTFFFLSKPLLLTLNNGHYTPKSPCSSPNGLLFTLNYLSGYLSMSVVPPLPVLTVVSTIRPSVYLYIRPSFHPSVCMSLCMYVCLFVCLSVCLSVFLSVFLSVCLSVCCGGCCARKARSTKLMEGVDLNGWGWAGASKTIMAREIYCAKPNLKPDSQSGSRFHKGL